MTRFEDTPSGYHFFETASCDAGKLIALPTLDRPSDPEADVVAWAMDDPEEDGSCSVYAVRAYHPQGECDDEPWAIAVPSHA